MAKYTPGSRLIDVIPMMLSRSDPRDRRARLFDWRLSRRYLRTGGKLPPPGLAAHAWAEVKRRGIKPTPLMKDDHDDDASAADE